MNLWREAILQFVYPQSPACPLCGNHCCDASIPVCRLCHLDLIGSGKGSDAILSLGVSSWHDQNSPAGSDRSHRVRIRSVGFFSGKMKSFLRLLRSNPDQELLSYGVGLLTTKAGVWLAEIDAVVPLAEEDENRSHRSVFELAEGFSKKSSVPVIPMIEWNERNGDQEKGEEWSDNFDRNDSCRGKRVLLISDFFASSTKIEPTLQRLFRLGVSRVDVLALCVCLDRSVFSGRNQRSWTKRE